MEFWEGRPATVAGMLLQREETEGVRIADMPDEEIPRLVPLITLALGIVETAKAVLNVHCDLHLDSGYILSRALVEPTINYAFLSVCSD